MHVVSRNLGTDRCAECNWGPFGIADIAGRPVEFRGYGKYVPKIGVRVDCPRCGTAYFAAYRTRGDCVGCHVAGVYPPDEAGTWEIDLSYWATYNDEPDNDDMEGVGEARWLVTEGREEQRFGLSDGEPDRKPFTVNGREVTYAWLKAAASNPTTPPDDLDAIASLGVSRITSAVAANPSTPERTLRRLVEDGPYGNFDSEVAANPSVPDDIAERFASSEWQSLRRAVAGNTGVPDRIRAVAALGR